MSKILCLYNSSLFYGHERSNIEVFRTLKQHDLHVLSNSYGIDSKAKEILDNEDIKCSSIKYPVWKHIRKPFNFFNLLRFFLDAFICNISFIIKWCRFKPDFIYLSNDFVYLVLSPSLLLIHTPIVYRIGDAPLVHWKIFDLCWRKFIVKRTYKFVCISNYIRTLVNNLGRDLYNNSDIVIYNLPPTRNVFSDSLPYSKKNGITFGYLGQIIENKGVAIFISAAIEICSLNRGVQFVLAGSLTYDKRFSDKIFNLVETSGFGERITFFDQVENIESFFNLCDVLVTPSLKEEPLGNVIVEAKKYRTPSIIFPSGGMPELILHKVNGFICSSSEITSLIKALDFYIKNPDLITEHGFSAFNSIAELQIGYDYYKNRWYSIFN